jgi:hypothetical protein
MFRRFLDATDYWFGCSDDSSTGSYDLARECCVVIANDPANATGATGTSDREVPTALGDHFTSGCRAKRPCSFTPNGGRYRRAAGSSA